MNTKIMVFLLSIFLLLVLVAIMLIPVVVVECTSDDDCYKTCLGCTSEHYSDNCSLPPSLCKCIQNSCQYILSEEEVTDIIDEKFPERNKTIVLDIDEEPTWTVNFTAGNQSTGTSVSIVVSAGSGGIVEETCNGAECFECSYSTTEITPWGEIVYHNTGCDNPTPTCDVSNICRPCESEVECLRKTLSSTIRLDIGQILTQHYYSVIGTGVTAHYNETDMNCTIYGEEVFSDIIPDIVECEQEILSHVICDGECKEE